MRTVFLLLVFILSVGYTHAQGHSNDLVQIHGAVVDSITGELLQATVYALAPDDQSEIAFTDTNTEGDFGLVLKKAKGYFLEVELEGYETYTRYLALDPYSKAVEVRLLMHLQEDQ